MDLSSTHQSHLQTNSQIEGGLRSNDFCPSSYSVEAIQPTPGPLAGMLAVRLHVYLVFSLPVLSFKAH